VRSSCAIARLVPEFMTDVLIKVLVLNLDTLYKSLHRPLLRSYSTHSCRLGISKSGCPRHMFCLSVLFREQMQQACARPFSTAHGYNRRPYLMPKHKQERAMSGLLRFLRVVDNTSCAYCELISDALYNEVVR
jgi:hypothetical protein